MSTGFINPMVADASMELRLPNEMSNVWLNYQIISAVGKTIRQGSFKGCFIHISTRLLPKGERFILRLQSEKGLLHEERFETC